MKILVQTTHPAHVHFYKYFIREMIDEGYEIKVFATSKDISLDLLDNFGIEYEAPYTPPKRKFVLNQQPVLTYELYKMTRDFQPDVITSVGGTSASHVSTITNSKSVVFYDTEHATAQNTITYPFSDVIVTPSCYQDDLGSKQVRYDGYQELAYLHPNRFTPDPSILRDIDAEENDRLVIMRLVSWDAVHDIGDSGFSNVHSAVTRLEEAGARVLITSEDSLPEGLVRCRIDVSPERIHDLMYYSDLFIGESATMATESAVLGTPGVFVSTSRRGYTDELEQRYGLVYNFSEEDRQQKALRKAETILQEYNPKEWEQRRQKMLSDKIDTTEIIISEVLGRR